VSFVVQKKRKIQLQSDVKGAINYAEILPLCPLFREHLKLAKQL